LLPRSKLQVPPGTDSLPRAVGAAILNGTGDKVIKFNDSTFQSAPQVEQFLVGELKDFLQSRHVDVSAGDADKYLKCLIKEKLCDIPFGFFRRVKNAVEDTDSFLKGRASRPSSEYDYSFSSATEFIHTLETIKGAFLCFNDCARVRGGFAALEATIDNCKNTWSLTFNEFLQAFVRHTREHAANISSFVNDPTRPRPTFGIFTETPGANQLIQTARLRGATRLAGFFDPVWLGSPIATQSKPKKQKTAAHTPSPPAAASHPPQTKAKSAPFRANLPAHLKTIVNARVCASLKYKDGECDCDKPQHKWMNGERYCTKTKADTRWSPPVDKKYLGISR
jgi:hypothetical protein